MSDQWGSHRLWEWESPHLSGAAVEYDLYGTAEDGRVQRSAVSISLPDSTTIKAVECGTPVPVISGGSQWLNPQWSDTYLISYGKTPLSGISGL